MGVEVKLLGGFEVVVDGVAVPAGAWSRRHAAALVKLLALAPGRQLHREVVIDALWPELSVEEAAPRLHKAAHYARRAAGAADAVVLRGEGVALFPERAVHVDVRAFDALADRAERDGGVEAAAVALECAGGVLLPGDPYEPWTETERERLRHRHALLLRQAQRWEALLALDVTDEEAQVALLQEHLDAGDARAVLAEFERIDRRLRRETGDGPGRAAVAIRDRALGLLRERHFLTPADEGRVQQEIRFCRTADGTSLAYAMSGDGPPLVKAANWLTHLDHDWDSPVWRHWLLELSRRHRLVRYDERGCGLSDWDVADWSLDAWVADLESVVDDAGLDRFPLLGISQGGAVAVAYAVRHPERVTRLVLYGTYPQGSMLRATTEAERERRRLEVQLARVGWGLDDPAFRQVFTAQFMPDGSKELWSAFNELQRLTTSPENAARTLELTGAFDVVDLARQVRVPTLVLHARDDRRPPFSQGRLLASLIPGARFVALDSSNHILLGDEPAWERFVSEVEAFLAG